MVYHFMGDDDIARIMRHPMVSFASDAGVIQPGSGVPHPRGYGNAVRVLGEYVRERKTISLEEAVRKMTSLPARTFRLKNRGELRVGAVADIVIFDPEKVGSPSTFDDPHHYATGFSDVIVNGVAVIRETMLTEARSGTAVRLNQ